MELNFNRNESVAIINRFNSGLEVLITNDILDIYNEHVDKDTKLLKVPQIRTTNQHYIEIEGICMELIDVGSIREWVNIDVYVDADTNFMSNKSKTVSNGFFDKTKSTENYGKLYSNRFYPSNVISNKFQLKHKGDYSIIVKNKLI